MDFTLVFEGDAASNVAWYGESGRLNRLHQKLDIDLRCRAPFCHSSLDMYAGGRSTTVTLHQSIAGDAVSFSPQRLRRLQEEYNIHTRCRAPLCIGTLSWVAGSISVRVVLDIPNAPPGSTPDSMLLSSTAAAVTAAANELARLPVANLSALLNETVVSTALPVVGHVRRISARLVVSIPDSNADATSTLIRINSTANALAAQPTAIEAFLNATVISTSPVVIGHAVVPLVVSTSPAASRERLDAILTALLLAVMVLVLVCIRVWWRWRRQHAGRKELLAEARERRDMGIDSGDADEPRRAGQQGAHSSVEDHEGADGGEGKVGTTEISSPSLAEQVKDRVRMREVRKSEALEEMRKQTSSFALPKMSSAKFTTINDVTRSQVKSLARAERESRMRFDFDADVWREEEAEV